ncbi:MMPL family transporter [Viridibacillus sp. NPDC096237]|uniref:MMPL family transporter n=1 Tax=Viridibacillus sp. NPDC096237 TaxID=3390721 RepID=UPI003D015554
MKKFINVRSVALVAWLVITIVMVLTMPNMDRLVKEKGRINIGNTVQSGIATEMMKEMNDNSGEHYYLTAVFHSDTDKKLSVDQLEEIHKVVASLKNHEDDLGITAIMAHTDSKELKSQLVSEDGTTILTQFSIDKKQGELSNIVKELNTYFQMKNVNAYLTGNDLVISDFAKSTQEGVKKTEVIAIVFIIVVLILVFRSPIVPLISLVTVGIAYIVSLGIIAHLVDKWNFPFSNFTQVFLVVALFGIGTDYNILLYTRFKKELRDTRDNLVAVKATYKTAGKTVLYSGAAVFIGFIALSLSDFPLYKASSLVAVGVGGLLLVLVTLNPFFMVFLGKKMFWPIRNFEGQGNSRLWSILAKHAYLRPILWLLLVAVICTPFILKYSGELNYNDLLEISDSYESKQGIKVIEEHFPSGFSSPTNIVIKGRETLDNQKFLQALDELTQSIAEINGVSKVYSSTRPEGNRVKELYLNRQTDQVNSGLGNAKEGIGAIHDGLSTAEDRISKANDNGIENVQKLIDGTTEVKSGMLALNSAMEKVTNGFQHGVTGAGQIQTGLHELNSNIEKLSDGSKQLQDGYAEIYKGMNTFSQYFSSLSDAISGARQGYTQIEISMRALIKSNPELENDKNIRTTLHIARAGQLELTILKNQMNRIEPQYKNAMDSFNKANTSLSKINNGLTYVEQGVKQLQNGAGELKTGLDKGEAGSRQITSNLPQLQTGLTQINNGQEQLKSGLSDLQNHMKVLQKGLLDSTDGLDEVSTGLANAQNYLGNVSNSNSTAKFFVPKNVLEGEDFQKSLAMYMSENRKLTRLMVVLDVNPYSKEAMHIVEKINERIESVSKTGELKDTKIAVGGKSSQNLDLQDISSSDFTRTIIIMLVGIGIVLVIITRSFWKSIIIIASLIIAYYSSLGISELISKYILDIDTLSWNVPFFGFIMLISLGVDYSIFLMMRYNELEQKSSEAIIEAAKNMGAVVLSAAIILGGTFAALIPSGILTLIQVALVVIVGLVLMGLLLMPIFIPSMFGLTNKLRHIGVKLKSNTKKTH